MKRRSLSSVNLFSFFLLIDYFVSVIPELHECFKVFLSSYQQSHWIVLFATNNKSEIEISTDLSHVTPFCRVCLRGARSFRDFTVQGIGLTSKEGFKSGVETKRSGVDVRFLHPTSYDLLEA